MCSVDRKTLWDSDSLTPDRSDRAAYGCEAHQGVVAAAATLYLTRIGGASGCGVVQYNPAPDYEGSVRIVAATGIGCVAARQVVRSCAYQETVPGWRSAANRSGFTLISGARRIVVRGIAGGGLRCAY